MAKKKTVKKTTIAPVPHPDPNAPRLSAPALPDHLERELAEHTKANAEAAASSQSNEASDDGSDAADALDASSNSAQTVGESEQDDVLKETEDAETNAAVDDIIRSESDAILADEDAKKSQVLPAKPRGFWGKIGHFFAVWWHNPWARNITLAVLVVVIAVLAIIPTTRYGILNFAGVRSSSSLTVIDGSTRLPLKNVTVTIGTQKALTDSNGVAKLEKLKLGKQHMTIKRIAFAPIAQTITIGWGSNPQGEFILDATGVQYRIQVKDYITNKPVLGAEATSGEAVAKADEKGVITLTLEDVDTSTVPVTVTAPAYRKESLTITANTETTTVLSLVTAARDVFFARQNGTLNVQSMYLDGKDRKTELAGTGRENRNVGLAVNEAGTQAAVVSTRDDVRDDDGFLLSTLTVIDMEKGTKQKVGTAEHIQLIDWIGPHLIFVETSAGASAANPNRYRLVSYELTTNKRTQLASANQFNATLTARGYVYYAISSTDPHATAAFFRVRPDGSGRSTVFNREAWTVVRNSYTTFLLQSPDSWYQYTLDGATQKTTPPAVFQSRRYVDGPHDKTLWVDIDGGKNALHLYDIAAKKDTTIVEQQGLSYPLRWLTNDVILYRVATDAEVADYAVSVHGGAPRKITDVVNAYGFGTQ